MPAPIANAETTTEQPASDNLSLAALGQRMKKGRKAASAPAPVPPPSSDDAAAEAGSSEHSLAEAAGSPSETVDSADVTAETAAPDVAAESDGSDKSDVSDESDQPDGSDPADPKPPKSVRDLQKRVGKVTEQRNEAREEAEYWKKKATELGTRNAERGTEQEVRHPADETFVEHREIQEFDETLTRVEGFLTWAEDHPDGGTLVENGKTYELSAEDVKAYVRKGKQDQIRLNARREAKIESLRVDFETKRKAAHAEAARLYPWIEQKGTPEFQEAVAIIRENPGVLQRPDFELLVARQVVGQRLEREALKKLRPGVGTTTRPKGSTTPAPVVTRTATTGTPRQPASAEVKSAETQFHTTGRLSDLASMLAKRRAARLAEAQT